MPSRPSNCGTVRFARDVSQQSAGSCSPGVLLQNCKCLLRRGDARFPAAAARCTRCPAAGAAGCSRCTASRHPSGQHCATATSPAGGIATAGIWGSEHGAGRAEQGRRRRHNDLRRKAVGHIQSTVRFAGSILESQRAAMGRPAKRAKAAPTEGGELARALNWLNSYNKVLNYEQMKQGARTGCRSAGCRSAPVSSRALFAPGCANSTC